MIKSSFLNTCSNLSIVKYTYLDVQNEFHLYNHYMNFASFYIKIVKINISEICDRKKMTNFILCLYILTEISRFCF